MMRSLAVCALSCALPCALLGCYASHERGMRDATSRPDATTQDAGLVLDAHLFDGHALDARLDARARGDAACLDNTGDHVVLACVLNALGVIPPMRESTLTLERSACVCPAQRSCSVRAEGGLLRVQTRSCLADVECDTCDSDQACTVPPLAPGPYRLVVDGLETYTLQVGGEPPAPMGPRCYRLPAPISELPDDFCVEPRGIASLTRECHRSLEDVGTRATFTLTSACLDCNLWTAGCEARVLGSRIVLSPRLQDCTCTRTGCSGVCEACSTHEVVCTTPALREGEYTVETGGSAFASLRVEDVVSPGPVTCTDLAP